MQTAEIHYTMLNGKERALSKAELNMVEWPDFMIHDEVEARYWHKLATSFADFQFALFDGPNIIGYANSIPLSLNANRIEYHERGWDWALEKGFADLLTHRKFTVLCGLQIGINKQYQGRGISALFIDGMKQTARAHGLKAVILPIRPTLKHRYPLINMEDYITWQNDVGLPFDPWIRTHVKLGAKIMRICPRAMQIKGRISEWRSWTGLDFQTSGQYVVDGALVPVNIDVEKDLGEYIEPNLWIRHNL